MIKKLFKYGKILMALTLISALTLPSYATVGASDGSAFVTKAEFDAALSDFNARLTTFEAGINSKIDSQVSSYLDRNGIWNGKNLEWNDKLWMNNDVPSISFDPSDFLLADMITQTYSVSGTNYDISTANSSIYRGGSGNPNFSIGYATAFANAKTSFNNSNFSKNSDFDGFVIANHWMDKGRGANNYIFWSSPTKWWGSNAGKYTPKDKKIKLTTATKTGLVFIHWNYNTESNGFFQAATPIYFNSVRDQSAGCELNADWVPFASFGVGFMIGDEFQNRHELNTVTVTAMSQYQTVMGMDNKAYATGFAGETIGIGPSIISIPFNFGDVTTNFFVKKGDEIFFAPHSAFGRQEAFTFGALGMMHMICSAADRSYSRHGGQGMPVFGFLNASIY